MDDLGAVYRGGPTVGSKLRVRYYLVRSDVDVSDLSRVQQHRLGELYPPTDPAAKWLLKRS